MVQQDALQAASENGNGKAYLGTTGNKKDKVMYLGTIVAGGLGLGL